MGNSKFNLNIKDILIFFKNIKKQISKRSLIIEFSDQNLKLVEAKLINKRLSFRAFRNIVLPIEAISKGVPNDPEMMSKLILDLMEEENINIKSASVVLNSESIYIKNIYLPKDLTKKQAIKYIMSPSNQQLPIPLSQLDFDLIETSVNHSSNLKKEFILIAIPKKLTNIISETLELAGLDLKLLDYNCISNTRLLYNEQTNLKPKEHILLLDFRNDATFLTLIDRNGPLLIERISSIREYPHNFNESISNKKDYLELSNLDLKIIEKDITKILINYFKNKLDLENYSVFIMGPNSAHTNIVSILGSLLNKNVYLISPTNCEGIHEAIYSDEINEFLVASLIGTGLGLSKSININPDKTQEFKYIRKFIFDKSKIDSSKDLNKSKINLPLKNKLKSPKKEKNYSVNKDLTPDDKSKNNLKNEEKVSSFIKDDTNSENKLKNNLNNDKEFKFDKKFLE